MQKLLVTWPSVNNALINNIPRLIHAGLPYPGKPGSFRTYKNGIKAINVYP